MNIQDYISSGIVETYVLGLASEEESREFELMCQQHPEVLAARTSFELAMEKQAMENAVAPAANLKSKIWEEIGKPATVVSTEQAPVRSINWWKYAAAACLLLLAGSLYMNLSLSEKNRKLQDNYQNTVAELNTIKKDIQVLTEDPTIKMAAMTGQSPAPQAYATVYWDTTSHDVYLLANNLPKPANDMQYQLWAFIKGQPVDLGYFDVKKEKLLIQAKNAQGVEAFAITLEKKGRPDPSKPEGQVYVMGKL